MISTTYLSAAHELWSGEQLERLLAGSRTSNAEAGITGVLLYSGGNFVQTLEGPAEAVDATMAKVLDAPRHKDVYVVRREEIAERAFAGWSMGFRQVPAERAAEIPGFTDYLRTGTIEGETARRHAATSFHRVFRRHIREADQPWGDRDG